MTGSRRPPSHPVNRGPRDRNPAAGYPRSTPMKNPVLNFALGCAQKGWPVFPCQPGQKTPATAHGYRDATTDYRQIRQWFDAHPDYNLAIATGAPGPDVLDVDDRGPAGSGYPALQKLRSAGLLTNAGTYVRTPGGGLHAYFSGSAQRTAHLPGQHLDFMAAGGYVLAPPSQVGGKHYEYLWDYDREGFLDWDAATSLLQPARDPRHPEPRLAGRGTAAISAGQVGALARWVAAQPEGNRNAGLFWAANRALEANHAADLSPLAAAARQAGLQDTEIDRTLNSARRTTQPRPEPPDHQPEGAS
jgi:hypothetical protein